MKLKLQRLATTAGSTITFTFDVEGSVFLVKNFSQGDIHVCFESGDPNKILIPAQTAQEIHFGWGDKWNEGRTKNIYVTADAASEKGVEVQCLKW